MLIAALDTTTRSGSCALVRGASVIGLRVGDPARPHAGRLPGDLLDLLASHGLALADVEAFAVAAGPGSFTGLRIGIAAAQGLAFATGRPVVGVSALDALAHAATAALPAGASRVGVWMDAQRGEVFAALYRVGPGDGDRPDLAEEHPAIDATPGAVLARWQSIELARCAFVGDGALVYRSRLEAAGIQASAVIEPTPPIAASVAALALARLATGQPFHPHAVVPIYVRRPDAELARDRQTPAP
jgi:tRNA threonylcarbamoyladenosine biosynthesis protein TsaB